MRKFIYLIFVLLFLSPFSLFAQKERITISGYIREKGSGELLPGVNIFIPGLNKGTVTNNYGFYSITIPEGYKKINYSFVGYQTVNINTDTIRNRVINVELSSGSALREVEVVGTASDKVSNNTRTDYISVPVNQIKEIPALLGEKDVFKTLQLLPGVKKGQEGTSGIYVRGGGPDQNLVILDDATVYNVNHLFGFFSIFNGDAIKSVELTKGGFPSRFGGRLSSVVEMTMKDGNKEKTSGEAGIGLISSRFTLEGPIKKNVSSYLISARRTYIDALIRPMLTSEERPVMYFYDLNAKVNYDFGYNNKLYLSGYFGRDKFGANDNYDDSKWSSGIYWQNATGTMRWNHLFSNKLFANTSFIFSNYVLSIYEKDSYKQDNVWQNYSLKYNSGIRDLSLKYDMDFHPTAGYLIKMGAISTQHQFKPSALVVKDSESPLSNTNNKKLYNSLESAVYMENHLTIQNLFQINGGARFTHFIADHKNYFRFEPRLSLNYQFLKNTSAKASYADMNQYVHLLSNTGIGLPTDLWVPSTGRIAPQHSRQISAGVAHDMVKQKLTFTVEGYYKTMQNIIGYKPGANFLLLDDPESSKDFDWQDNTITGQGKAYGIEMMLQRKTGRLSGWIGYTLSWAKQQFDGLNNGNWFWAKHDRRHDISVVGIYELSKRVTLSGTWVYSSGNAYTMPVGEYYPKSNNMLRSSLFSSSYYSTTTDYGKYNNARMGAYHRLDLSISFRKQKKHYLRTWELGLYNAYSHQNPFFYVLEEDKGVNKLYQYSLFPAIPSISYNIKF